MQANDHDAQPQAGHGDFLDHERLTWDRFRCPECGRTLELIELRKPVEERRRNPDAIEWIAACRHCEIALSKDEWSRRRVA